MSDYHIPVLKNEALEILNVKPDNWYIDCNLGGGGHTEAILEAKGKVLAIDMDPDSIKHVQEKLAAQINNRQLIVAQANFVQIHNLVEQYNVQPMGVLYDLGLSSHQLNDLERGFSFNSSGPLDMRMDPNIGVPAADLINGLHEKELADLFWRFGEERFSRQIAKAITLFRINHPITTSSELAEVILTVCPRTSGDRIHPATRVFQALRIIVNDELNALRESLPNAFKALAPGGRLVVISFHSLEDRIIKDFFNEQVANQKALHLIKKPLIPTETEIHQNPRSRSSKLRAIEKIA
jgi:16S rRNA (cytosine1402-N4)-methyltransferase